MFLAATRPSSCLTAGGPPHQSFQFFVAPMGGSQLGTGLQAPMDGWKSTGKAGMISGFFFLVIECNVMDTLDFDRFCMILVI